MRTIAVALLSVMALAFPMSAVKQGTNVKLQVKSPSLSHSQQNNLSSDSKKSKTLQPKPKPVAVAPVVAAQVPVPAPVQEAPAPIVYPVGCQTYLPIVQQYNWNVSVAMAIMQAESGCNPNDVSPASINWDGVSDYGLFQIHGLAVMNPADNIAYAYYHKYVQSGWSPWTTYTSGKYLQYL